MDAPTLEHPVLGTARELDPSAVEELAATYREWRGVLAGAVNVLVVQGCDTPRALLDQLCEVLAESSATVDGRDASDAAMALWLHTAATEIGQRDAVTDLLNEPWRVFNTRRTADRLHVAV